MYVFRLSGLIIASCQTSLLFSTVVMECAPNSSKKMMRPTAQITRLHDYMITLITWLHDCMITPITPITPIIWLHNYSDYTDYMITLYALCKIHTRLNLYIIQWNKNMHESQLKLFWVGAQLLFLWSIWDIDCCVWHIHVLMHVSRTAVMFDAMQYSNRWAETHT